MPHFPKFKISSKFFLFFFSLKCNIQDMFLFTCLPGSWSWGKEGGYFTRDPNVVRPHCMQEGVNNSISYFVLGGCVKETLHGVCFLISLSVSNRCLHPCMSVSVGVCLCVCACFSLWVQLPSELQNSTWQYG